MNEWWAGLTFEQQVYYGIALIATMLVLIQTLMLMIGAGGDELADAGDVDMDGPDEHPSGIHLLSSRTIVAFFVGFGWTGVIASRDGPGEPATTVAAALLVGMLFAYVIFRLMKMLSSLRDEGTLDYQNTLGEVGTVYLRVPPGMKGNGSIQVMIQGRLKVIQALTQNVDPIESRAKVRVVEVMDDNTLVVEPVATVESGQEVS